MLRAFLSLCQRLYEFFLLFLIFPQNKYIFCLITVSYMIKNRAWTSFKIIWNGICWGAQRIQGTQCVRATFAGGFSISYQTPYTAQLRAHYSPLDVLRKAFTYPLCYTPNRSRAVSIPLEMAHCDWGNNSSCPTWKKHELVTRQMDFWVSGDRERRVHGMGGHDSLDYRNYLPDW